MSRRLNALAMPSRKYSVHSERLALEKWTSSTNPSNKHIEEKKYVAFDFIVCQSKYRAKV